MKCNRLKCIRLGIGLVILSLCAVHAVEPLRSGVPLGLDEFVPAPDDNSSTAAKIELGRQLFFDKRLSRDGTVSCATCHMPERAFANDRRLAIGIKGRTGRRNVPSILNRAYGKSVFWEGRVKALEDQPLVAITNRNEMDLALAELEKRVNNLRPILDKRNVPHPALSPSDGERVAAKPGAAKRTITYRQQFQDVFGEKPTAQNVAKALATFVRTLLSGNSAFDRFEHGDQSALSESARRGLQIFRGKGNCIACHSGPLLSDEDFHNTGVSWGREPLDLGRFEITGREQDRGKFKTPSLRNVARTSPYMHDGGLATLDKVVEFYSKGANPNPNLDREIRTLNLNSQEKADLITFLQALTSP